MPIKLTKKKVVKAWGVMLPNSKKIALYKNNFLAISDWNQKELINYAKEIGGHVFHPEVIEVEISYDIPSYSLPVINKKRK